MANTTNFNWETPDDTDLVKDGALAIRTLGNSIDTTLVDLKGGTTGQVLSKTSNTDMDFTWVTSDDANAIQNAIVDAKGDLIAASAADTPARLAVGNNGETLVADSSATTGLRWQGNFAAGKNAIINGDFSIWQRGTTFNNAGAGNFFADRFYAIWDGTGATRNITRETFTPGSAPVAGYEGQFFARYAQTVAGSGGTYSVIVQKIEDVRKFAGQTVTVSFWAKVASSTISLSPYLDQAFGSGGSSTVSTGLTTQTITTSWTRFTATVSVPSISGKTIGTGSSLNLVLYVPVNTTFTLDLWGMQVEAGSVATAFQTATGTLAGELQAAQRYYWRASGQSTQYFGTGFTTTTSAAQIFVQNPVPMRVAPTSIDTSGLKVVDSSTSASATAVIGWNAPFGTRVDCSFTGLTANRPAFLFTESTGHLGFSAEL